MLQALEASDRVGAVAYHVRGYPLVDTCAPSSRRETWGVARRARALRLRRRASRHGRLAPRTAELGPDLRDGRPRRALVRPRRARHQRPDRGSARRFPDVRAGQGARRPCNAAAPVRQRRHRQRRASAHWAAGRKNQLLFELEGSRAGFTWDQESPNELLHRHAETPTEVVVKDPGTNAGRAPEFARYPAGHAEGYGDAFRVILLDAYRAMAGEEHGPFPTFIDGHRGMQILAATLRSARDGGWIPVDSSPRAGARGGAPGARSRAARTPTPSGRATRRAAAPRARSPRA